VVVKNSRGRTAWHRVWRRVVTDLDMVRERDPSIRSRREAALHPGLQAIWVYRVAAPLHRRGNRLIARLLSNVARTLTGGIEIHPGATIGNRFFIDHGAGVVIGETATIGEDVTLFHQVTLGSVGWWHDSGSGPRRHPTLRDGVVVGANASILGPVTVGAGATVGAQSLVLTDIPAGARVAAPTATTHPSRLVLRRIDLRAVSTAATTPAQAPASQGFPPW